MQKHRLIIQWFVIFILGINLESCSSIQQVIQKTPTATLIPTSTATSTSTSTPTRTPRPTSTPNVIQTQNYDDIFSEVQKFKDEGLISSTNGRYQVLDDFTKTFAQRGWLSYEFFDFQAEQFLYKAHVRWSTSGKAYETSGCGIVFAVNPKGDGNDYYGVVLDQARIYFSVTRDGYYYDMGKTRGTGELDFENPAEANFALLVYDYKAYVYVDDEFIGQYTLSKSRKLSGKFGYGIISGTNHDYGTRCEITNSRMWHLVDP